MDKVNAQAEEIERLSGYVPDPCGQVPGVGPVLAVTHYNGHMFAMRSNGTKIVPYWRGPDTWYEVQVH